MCVVVIFMLLPFSNNCCFLINLTGKTVSLQSQLLWYGLHAL